MSGWTSAKAVTAAAFGMVAFFSGPRHPAWWRLGAPQSRPMPSEKRCERERARQEVSRIWRTVALQRHPPRTRSATHGASTSSQSLIG